MIQFKNVNLNPKGRKTGDCSTRAIANVLKISYEEALKEQYEAALKYNYGLTDKKTIEKVMKKFGWIKQKQPIENDIWTGKSKYPISRMDEILNKKQMEDGCLILTTKHATVVRNGYLEDLWDCTKYKIGNYWTKG